MLHCCMYLLFRYQLYSQMFYSDVVKDVLAQSLSRLKERTVTTESTYLVLHFL